MVKAIYSWKPISRRPIGRPKRHAGWMMLEKIYRSRKYQIGRLLPRIEDDGGSWLRGPKLYKRVVEQHKKKNKPKEETEGLC